MFSDMLYIQKYLHCVTFFVRVHKYITYFMGESCFPSLGLLPLPEVNMENWHWLLNQSEGSVDTSRNIGHSHLMIVDSEKNGNT